MTTLEARARRETLAKEIRMMAARAEDWTDADKAAWQITNTEYDRIDADLLQNRPPFGRDAASLNGLIGSDRSSSADMAVAAWCRNAHGTPIPRDEFDAALQFGQDPRGSAIEVRLRAGRPTRGLQVFNSQSTIPGRDGGFLVPGGFMPRLESALKSFSGMMQSSEIWITEFGHETPWPTVDDTSNVGYQLGENHETTETGMTFGAKIFRNYKMSSGLVRVSHELLRDNAVNLAGAIGDKLGERLGRILNDKTTNGSGPLSYLNRQEVAAFAAEQH